MRELGIDRAGQYRIKEVLVVEVIKLALRRLIYVSRPTAGEIDFRVQHGVSDADERRSPSIDCFDGAQAPTCAFRRLK